MASDEVLNMSLDDIISKNKTKIGGARRERGSDAPGKSRGGGSRRAGSGREGGGKMASDMLRVVVKNTGGIKKSNGVRGGRDQDCNIRAGCTDLDSQYFAPHHIRVAWVPEKKAPVDPAVLDGKGVKWQHDLYTDDDRPRRSLQQRLRGPKDGFRLKVTNLADGVTDDDIKELFESVGPVKFAAIEWDRSGRSTGEADVVYEQRADALKAKSQFNDVALDGQPMKIEMVESQGNERMLSSGIRVGEARNGSRSAVAFTRGFQRATSGFGSGRRGGRGRGRGGGGGGGRTVSTADLDKDLETYMQD